MVNTLPPTAHRWLAVALLVLGLYLPSSTGTEPTAGDFLLQFWFLAILLVAFLMRPGGVRGPWAIAVALAMNVLLGLFTLLSPFGELALGNYGSRFLFSLLLIVNLR